MGWDPSVLRRYNTTGHFRLLNQLRSELKGNPLIRPKDGETVGAANRSKSLTRALAVRGQGGGYGRSRRPLQAAAASAPVAPPQVSLPEASVPAPAPTPTPARVESVEAANARSFRERLNAIDMR